MRAGFCHDWPGNARNCQDGRIRVGTIVPALVSMSIDSIVTRDDRLDMGNL